MLQIIVSLQALILLISFSTIANSASSQWDETYEAEFCAMLENTNNFIKLRKFSEVSGHPIEVAFLNANCSNNSKIEVISGQKKAFPMTLVAANPEERMIFLEQLVKYIEKEKKLDDYKAILNRKDPAGRTILDVVEEQIAAVIKEGTNRALLNMHGFIRAEMCYRGGEYANPANAKICDNYPVAVYQWCTKTFSADNLGVCLGYRGKIPEKLMMMLTGKCAKLINDDEKLKTCLKPLQYPG